MNHIQKMSLNNAEQLVIHCLRMRLTEKESMKYLSDNGEEMSARHFYRIKGTLQAKKLDRLHAIARYGFTDQHLERIDTLELCQTELWKCFNKEESPYRKAMILKEIREIQPYLSSYYEATRMVLEKDAGEKTVSIPILGEPKAGDPVPELTTSP